MRLISMTTRDELVGALAGRYAAGSRADRGRMLDEFATLTGHHRKHAMRLLRAGISNGQSSPRMKRRIYDQATHEALIVVWEASDRICGKRLRPLVPILVSAMERHGHLQLAPEVLTGLLTMSAATMDRALREARGATGGGPRRRSPPSAAIRRSVAVRTFSDWDNPPPGFMEADLVAHSGPTAKGSYVQTLTLTDIATGWTECAPVLVREQKLLTAVLSEMRKVYGALARVDAPVVVAPAREPAVPVKRSIQHDYLVCLEDGAKLRILTRYLQRCGLTPDTYRQVGASAGLSE
jgi:hypothetical protein